MSLRLSVLLNVLAVRRPSPRVVRAYRNSRAPRTTAARRRRRRAGGRVFIIRPVVGFGPNGGAAESHLRLTTTTIIIKLRGPLAITTGIYSLVRVHYPATNFKRSSRRASVFLCWIYFVGVRKTRPPRGRIPISRKRSLRLAFACCTEISPFENLTESFVGDFESLSPPITGMVNYSMADLTGVWSANDLF